MAKRPVSGPRVTSAGEINQLQFNDNSFAQRNLGVGGVYDILGPAGSRVRVGYYSTILVANTTTLGQYLKFGDSTVTAPAGLADGIYLPPQSYTPLCAGLLGEWVIASNAGVGIYKLQENVIVREDNRKD